MRKLLAIILVMISLFVFTVPAFAEEWPPEEYETPRVLITQEQIKDSLSGLKTTIRSCVNIGLVISGILTSISLIGVVFKRIVIGGLNSADSSGSDSGGAYRETKL